MLLPPPKQQTTSQPHPSPSLVTALVKGRVTLSQDQWTITYSDYRDYKSLTEEDYKNINYSQTIRGGLRNESLTEGEYKTIQGGLRNEDENYLYSNIFIIVLYLLIYYL